MAFGFVRRHPVWTWIGLVLPLTTILVLIYIPRAIQWGLERWLEKQGRISVEIQDVDFSPFTGQLIVYALLAHREEGPGQVRSERVSLNIEWWPLTRKRLVLENVRVRDALMTVRQRDGAWYIGGIRIKTKEEKGTASAWQFGVGAIDLQNVKVLFSDGDIRQEFTIEEAHLDSMQEWNPDRMGQFAVRLQAEGTSMALTGQARPFADEPVVEGHLETDGFPLASLRPWLAGTETTVGQGRLSAALDFSTRLLPAEGRVRLTADGSVSVADLQASVPGYQVGPASVSWQGHLEVAAPREDKPPLLTADGNALLAGE